MDASKHSLSQDLLLRMIEAREIFINDDLRPPFDTIDDVKAYSKNAFSSAYYLLQEALLNDNNNPEMKGHARHAATQVNCFSNHFKVLSPS